MFQHSSFPMEDYFRCPLLILYVQQYSLRAYSPEVIHVDPEKYSPATWRDSPRSTNQTHHIQKRRTTKPRMATLSATPPGDTASIPSRTIPIRHRPTRNHQPKDPSDRRHWNREDCPRTTLRNRYHPDSQDAEAESPVYSHQLPRIPREPL